MSLGDWFRYNGGWRPGTPRPAQPRALTVDVDGIEVTEGPAAELSHRLHLEKAQQDALARADAERQAQLERALRALS